MSYSLHFLKINSPKVVWETIDGEVVIVNLEKGHYYSLVKVGCDIWKCLERKMYPQQIVEEMLERYEEDRVVIEKAVKDFLERLIEEDLILEGDADKVEEASFSEPQLLINYPEKLCFEMPILEKYTDMEDLLLLDPIHEVDEMGWPKAKPAKV